MPEKPTGRWICFAGPGSCLSSGRRLTHMKRIAIIGLTLALAACKVEKTGKDTYKVVTPTPEAKAAAQKLKQDAAKVGEKVKEESKEIENSQAVKKAQEN